METFALDKNISLIDLNPALAGYKNMLGVYVIRGEKTAILDPGPACAVNELFRGLKNLGIKFESIDYILASHIHLDHSGGVGHALKKMTSARIIVHEKGIPHLADPEKLWSSSIRVMGKTACDYMKPEPVDRDKMFAAYEDMTIDLKGIKLRIVSTPGHASHHYSLMDDENGRLFPGEAAGVYMPATGGIRPATPYPFNLEKAIKSVDKLISFNPKTIYFPHFNYSSNAVEKLKNSRAQMILWGRIIEKYREHDKEINLNIIMEDIKKNDPFIVPIFSLPDDQLQREISLIKNSINGYLKYFERKRLKENS
jgi:glyoxylase-like metal-dependent hydrolase (beta-lactamase superfamily II)